MCVGRAYLGVTQMRMEYYGVLYTHRSVKQDVYKGVAVVFCKIQGKWPFHFLFNL